MSNTSGILQPEGTLLGIRRNPSTVVRVNDERFNIPSPQRKIMLRQLRKALTGHKVPAPFWAIVQLCDLEKLEYLVQLAYFSLKIMDIVSDLVCGLPFKWTKHAPSIQSQGSVSSSNSSFNRRRGAAPVARYAARERDGYRCVITGTRKVYETTPIFPTTTGASRSQDDPVFPNLWRFVDLFWGRSTAERWRKAVFNNPADPDKPIEDCSNLICLRRDLRSAWLDGLFALRPAWMAEDKTKMELEFYWQPRTSHKIWDLVDLSKEPESTKHVNSVDRLVVVLDEPDNPTYRPIESGYRFSLTTDDPVIRPLPSFDLLDMQWHFTRLVSLSSATTFFEEDDGKSEERDDRAAARTPIPEQPFFRPDDGIMAWVHSCPSESSAEGYLNASMIGPLPGSDTDLSRSVSQGSNSSADSAGSGPVGSEESGSVIDLVTGTGQLSFDFRG
ncbi:hypothetical protein N7475_007780 [Penicillium sp. IBT 31633x]|nr:hypothetical protein N7475_007780 [Penicillium sp. IBT 31633x]